MRKHFCITMAVMCFALILTGCFLLNPIPEEYTEGVKVPREYPDDDLEIYDDATVFEVDEDDEEISLTYGTEDDIDDVIDHYEDLFDDNNLTIEEKEDDKDEFYAKGRGDGFVFEIEAEEASGGIEEELFETVVKVTVEFVGSSTTVNVDNPVITDRPETEPPSGGGEYDPNWDKDYSPFYVDVTSLANEELLKYIIDRAWYYIGYVDGSTTNIDPYSSDWCAYYSDGTFEVYSQGELITGTWFLSESTLYCTYANGSKDNWEIAFKFTNTSYHLYFYNDVSAGSYWMYTATSPSTNVVYSTAADMTAAAANNTFDCWYYLYEDGSIESVPPTSVTLYGDGTFVELYEGMSYTGTWMFTDDNMQMNYDDGDTFTHPVQVLYNSETGLIYMSFTDQSSSYETGYYVFVSR